MKKKRKSPPKGFRSKFEKVVADKLKELKIQYEYEKIKLPYILTKKYISDYSLEDGTLIEVKGYLRTADISKMKAVRAQHPDQRIVFIFQAPHKPVPRQKQTHAEWAEKNGYEWIDLEQLDSLKPVKRRRTKSEVSQPD